MTVRYYKTNAGSEANAAYEVVKQQTETLKQQAQSFAELFDGSPVLVTSITGRKFKGIQLNNFNSRPDNHLWTKPVERNHSVSYPRGKALKAADKAELEALKKRYWPNKPQKTEVSFDPLFSALGSNWGTLLCCGISFFEHDSALYITTKAELTDCTEILASEYSAADKARLAAAT